MTQVKAKFIDTTVFPPRSGPAQPLIVANMTPQFLDGALAEMRRPSLWQPTFAMTEKRCNQRLVYEEVCSPLAENLRSQITTDNLDYHSIIQRRLSVGRPAKIWELGQSELFGRNGGAFKRGRLFLPSMGEMEVGFYGLERYVLSRLKPGLAKRKLGSVLSLHYRFDQVYFHALHDVFTALPWLKKLGMDLPETIVVSERLAETTAGRAILGSPWLREREVIVQKRNEVFCCEKLYVVRPPMFEGPLLSEVSEAIADEGIERPPDQKVVLVRNQNVKNKRHCELYDEFSEMLAKVGYRKVNPADLSLEEQKKLFRSSKHIVAENGSGLTNMIFCQPGSCKVDLVIPDYWVTPTYPALAAALGLDLSAHLVSSVDRGSNRNAVLDRETIEAIVGNSIC